MNEILYSMEPKKLLKNVLLHGLGGDATLLLDVKEAGEVPQVAVPQTVAPGSEAIGEMKSNVAGEASTSDGPLGSRETAEEEQVDLEESAPKKARVE
ncbi:hypothetical protein Bca4012_025226 [Brassica carinata]|uniref:Uncharacterized protein n=1 Tax=Brassica carinata TaxID=52824 RepID=A0A8X8ARJ4_BRACI|nr:hypothetical protein Bca52824_022277 [Brassica carinata]